jgi:hypothetical protein
LEGNEKWLGQNKQPAGETMLDFWAVTPCGLAGRYKNFDKIYLFHLQVELQSSYKCFQKINVKISELVLRA